MLSVRKGLIERCVGLEGVTSIDICGRGVGVGVSARVGTGFTNDEPSKNKQKQYTNELTKCDINIIIHYCQLLINT